MALWFSAMEKSFASAVTKQMNSLTISCIRTLASREILESFGSSNAMSRATFAMGSRRSCSRRGSGVEGGSEGRRDLEFAPDGPVSVDAGASWRYEPLFVDGSAGTPSSRPCAVPAVAAARQSVQGLSMSWSSWSKSAFANV